MNKLLNKIKIKNKTLTPMDKAKIKVKDNVNKITYDVSAKEKKLLEFMKSRNLSVKEVEQLFYYNKLKSGKTYSIDDGKDTIRFGVVSDTHLGAKSCAEEELHNIYNIFYKEKIKDVLNAGDVTDGGGKVYPGHINELKVFGYDDMIKYTIKNYPNKPGITTHFINGNHDEDFFKHGGADIGKSISKDRSDMHYLGWYDANININGIKIGLHHGDGGNAYAYSYKLQKYVETLTGDMKPQVFLLGHYHSAIYAAIRNIHTLTPGCFQFPNNFSVRKMLPNIVGGYIIEITKTKDNEIRSFKPEFIQYFKK